ncbi:MAG: hypothetical protein ACRD21_08905 [Vicinamibacteria bacterium]
MAETQVLGSKGTRCTVFLEACDGVNPKTRVKALVRDRSGVRVMNRIFDTLEEALAYAQTLYQSAA